MGYHQAIIRKIKRHCCDLSLGRMMHHAPAYFFYMRSLFEMVAQPTNPLTPDEISNLLYTPTPETVAASNVPDYLQVREAALDDPISFWDARAQELVDWIEPYHTVLDDSNAPFYKWFVGGKPTSSTTR
jgi:hypothetical protein